jgi:hypothetical protein
MANRSCLFPFKPQLPLGSAAFDADDYAANLLYPDALEDPELVGAPEPDVVPDDPIVPVALPIP